MHGYEIIQELEAQSGGRWRPSAGSVYPTLQQLADEGFVTSDDVDGRRTYTLTEEGLAAADANPASDRWTDRTAGDEPELRTVGLQLIGAVMQVQRVGSSRAKARDEPHPRRCAPARVRPARGRRRRPGGRRWGGGRRGVGRRCAVHRRYPRQRQLTRLQIPGAGRRPRAQSGRQPIPVDRSS